MKVNFVSLFNSHDHLIHWQTFFFFFFLDQWNLWLCKIQVVFNPDCIPSNPVKSSTSLASKLFYVMGESPKSKLKRLVYFKWKKLNTDGLSCGNPGLTSAGGDQRNSSSF